MTLVDNRLKNTASGLRTNCNYGKSYAQSMKDNLQSKINEEFLYSSSVYDIEEESVFGTQIYETLTVRVNHAIDTTTGTKLGDDYREFIFKDTSHLKGLGYRYKFNNNVWLCINSDLYKFVTSSTTVKRCNNVYKWNDEFDILREEPCVIDYNYSGTSVDFDQSINIPSGNLRVTMQYNQYSKNIKINDRMIFSGQAYKIKSINNFFQNQTGIQDSTPLIYLDVYKDSIAEGDDLINNIPASNINYTISLDTMSIDQSIGYTTQLIATVKRNGEVYSTPVTWGSSDETVATVDSGGNVELITDGSAIITASMTENSDVNVDCDIIVQAVPVVDYEVRITPNVTELLESQTQAYVCQLYTNGVLTPSTFSFTGSGVSSANYILTTIDGNNFTVKNLKYSSGYLVISASDGSNVGEIQIKLRGAF